MKLPDAHGLTKYMIYPRFPATGTFMILIFTVPLLSAIIANHLQVDYSIIAMYLLLFSVPAFLSMFVTSIIWDYSVSLNFFSTLIEVIIFSAFYVIEYPNLINGLIITYAVSFGFRFFVLLWLHLTIKAAFFNSVLRLFVSVMLFLTVEESKIYELVVKDAPIYENMISSRLFAMRIVAISALLGLILVLFGYYITMPMKKILKINAFDIFLPFVQDWFTGSRNMEKYFASLGDRIDVITHIIKFGKKCVFVVPYAHPGPFGNVGSSNMPYMLSKRIEQKYKMPAFVFHGCATHDLNIVDKKNLDRVISCVEKSIAEVKCEGGISKVYRRDGVLLQRIGRKTVAIVSGHEGDIDIGVGLASADIFVDAHSSTEKIDYIVTLNKKEGIRIMENIKKMETDADLAKNAESLKIGVAGEENERMACGIGRGGIKIAAFEIGGQKSIYALYDSNNMESGLRDTLINAVKKATNADIVEVMTTDTHYINTVPGGINPMTYSDAVIARSIELAKEASENMERVAGVGTHKVIVRDVSTMGQFAYLFTSVNITTTLFITMLPVVMLLIIAAIMGSLIIWG